MSQLYLDLPKQTELSQVWKGTIAQPPLNFLATMGVIIPDMHPGLVHPGCRWQARDNMSLPQEGDDCLVALDNNREPWVITWWPSERSPSVVTGPISSGPPPNPMDEDIWIAQVGSGVTWQFQYNAASVSPYKWEFIGGATVINSILTQESMSTNTWSNLATVGPQFALPRGGDYLVGIEAAAQANNNVGYFAPRFGAAATLDNDAAYVYTTTSTVEASVGRTWRYNGLAAALNIKMEYRSSNTGIVYFARRSLTIQPVRIS